MIVTEYRLAVKLCVSSGLEKKSMGRKNLKDSSGASNPSNLLPPVHTTRKHREREEKRYKLGTCAIGEKIPMQSDMLLGTGSLVKDFFENSLVKGIYLITSDEVISSDDLSRYFLRFKKLNGKVKERPLRSVGDTVIFKSPGLAIVPVDRNKFSFIRKRTSGLLHHRPFTLYNEENEGGIISESYFHAVVEFGNTSFEIKPFPADKISTETESVSWFRKSLGAPILFTSDGKAKAVGAITRNNKQISRVLFSQIDRYRICSDTRQAEGGHQGPEEGEGEQLTGTPVEGEGEQLTGTPVEGEGEQPPGEPVEGGGEQDEREAEGGEHQPLWEPVEGGREQLLREPGALQIVQADTTHVNEPNMSDSKALKQEKKIGHLDDPKEVAQRGKEALSDSGYVSWEEYGSDDDRNQLEDVPPQGKEQPKKRSGRKQKKNYDIIYEIHPSAGYFKGGIKFLLVLIDAVPEDVISCEAEFEDCGVVPLTQKNPYSLEGLTPCSDHIGMKKVTLHFVTAKGSRIVGSTSFRYDDPEGRAQIVSHEVTRLAFFELMACSEVNENTNAWSVEVLQLLFRKAVRIGCQEFIEIIFCTDAAHAVLNSFESRSTLPEDFARRDGHEELADYIQNTRLRLSKEGNTETKNVDWFDIWRVASEHYNGKVRDSDGASHEGGFTDDGSLRIVT